MTNTGLVLRFLRGAKRYFAAGIFLACFSTAADMLRPRIIRQIVDELAGGGMAGMRGESLLTAACLIFVCTLAAVLFRYGFQVTTVLGGEQFVKTMRDDLYEQLDALPASWLQAHRTGDLIQRCSSDVEEVKNFLADQLTNLLSILLTIGMALLFMIRIDPALTLAAFAGMPFLVISSVWFHSRITSTFRACDENEGALSAIAQENLTGVRVVRAFGREKQETERFARQNDVVTKEWVKLGAYFSAYFAFADFLTGSLTVILLSWGSCRCLSGQLTVGGLLAMVTYMGMLARPVRRLGRVLSELGKTGVSVSRLCEIMNAPREQDPPDAVSPDLRGEITFSHVSFAYPGKEPLLRDVSFSVPAGSILGILGNTGSGKSTIALLLDKLLPLAEDKGRIGIDGIDIRRIRTSCLRKQIGLVLQDPFLFSRTLGENIGLGKKELTAEELREAAKNAELLTTVEGFEQGFATFVGERGVTLSGGQKQRTAIARTLTRHAPILIFDDSLSAVDAETDERIRTNLQALGGSHTVILISHRISTLKAADRILVLENGRITQSGTHRQLRQQEGLYRQICRIQEGKEE